MSEEETKKIHEDIQDVAVKLDGLTKMFHEHIVEHKADREELRTLLETRSNFAFLYKSILGLGSLAAAWLAIRSALGK